MKPTFEPIAIVGQACVLPGALSPAELWAAVAAGRDLTSSAPEGRWGLPRELAIAEPGESPRDRAWGDRGGYVRGFEEVFDPEGFALPAKEILALDPLFQWVLHTGREALRDAGEADRERTGVVLGNLSFPSVGASRFAESVWLAGELPGRDPRPADPRDHFMSGLPAHLLARALGLGGSAFALDAACASSLVALKLACDRLHDRRADVMLAGAVSCADDLFIHVGFTALEALSPSGRSRPFHRGADGLLPAEGAAFVALRRLDDAVARGDEILGVIRGVGLSNDGRGGGLLAPSVDGQVRAIRRAYEVSGWSPAEVSLVECHATGTQKGDAAEIHSLSQLYSGLEGVPLGSLKSNLGHLITAAGLAGLLKVLAALRAGVRPPTLHSEPANPALEGSPFRLLREAEPWDGEAPRRAAISAFGFGGNNAHLLVEEWRSGASAPKASPLPAPTPAPMTVAIVGLAARAADATNTLDFTRVLLSGESRLREGGSEPAAGRAAGGPAESIELPLAGLGFPPNDLKQTLPQQLLLLATARQALETVRSALPRERTAVMTGMRCDAEIARYGLRWRLAGWGEGLDPEWVANARDSLVGGLEAAGVVGTMPNMTANRLNSQLDLGGASASVSSEELSGIVALDLAARALSAGEIDAALVGAADLCCEPVHEAAVRALAGERPPGDAATVLVLKRLDDARRDGDVVYARIEGISDPAGQPAAAGLRLLREDGGSTVRVDLAEQVGHSHAASGLLHVAAAALACHHRTLPASHGGSPVPWLSRGKRRAEVVSRAFDGRSASVRLRAGDRAGGPGDEPSSTPWKHPRIHLYAGADRAEVLSRLEAGRDESPSLTPVAGARLALVAADGDELARRREQAMRWLSGDRQAATERGVYWRERPLEGELAFVFAGAGAAYPGMGRQLLLTLPGLLDRLGRRMEGIPAAAGWVYRAGDEPLSPLRQLWGSSFLSQIHAQLTLGTLGLEPAAVLGYSSGESNSLMALGAWEDLDELYRDTHECGIFTHELGGELAAVRRAWQSDVTWSNHVLSAPVDRVQEALAGENRAHLTLISSPDDVVIGGDAAACRRVIDRLGVPSVPLGYDLAVHCPEVQEVADAWLELHRRPTQAVPGVRFYTHSTLDHYAPDEESAAQAILGQAVRTLDFPALISKAAGDGVRIFVEHGPRGLCSRWIRKSLTARGVDPADYLAVALDRAGDQSIRPTVEAVAQLLTAGVDLRWEAFAPRPAAAPAHTLTFPAHWPPVRLRIPEPVSPEREITPMASETPVPTPTSVSGSDPGVAAPQIMARAPALPSVLDDATAATAPSNGGSPIPASPEPTPVEASFVPPSPAATETPADLPALAAAGPAPSAVTTAGVEPTPAPRIALAPEIVPTSTQALGNTVLSQLSDLQRRIAAAQTDFLDRQTALHQQFLAFRRRNLDDLARAYGRFPATGLASPRPAVAREAAPVPPTFPPSAKAEPNGRTAPAPEAMAPKPLAPPAPIAPKPLAPPTAPPTGAETVTRARAESGNGSGPAPALAPREAPEPPSEPDTATERPGLRVSRQGLETLASGKISEIFGPLFEGQDGFHRQTRMPEPPFLLADRVTGLDAEPRSMGTGTIWTETDVTRDSWYLHRGHMPGGLMIEAGQADLLLISWLGVDFLNRDERVYRLLGCELTYRGGLPAPGDTLAYDIHVDGHAEQGDVRLFFFHYDCRIDGEVRLEVRHGQAGFFTDEELADSAGVLWDPAEEPTPEGRLDAPRALTHHRSFSPEQMRAFSLGRVLECMGPGFELAAAHSLTPTIQDGRMMLLDRISHFEPEGGPWKRGYLKAVTAIAPDSWIFEGHFKNDPCMPGTLMLEGCFQAMAFYLAAHGHTLERDGWRFEPVPDETYLMRCRGQAIPTSRELTYELFVHQLIDGPEPTLFADLLCTVDGLKAFHARRLGLRLVPDWPLGVHPEWQDQPFPGGERPAPGALAERDGFRFDYASLLACAWGQPSHAFGPMYRVFDSHRKVARLPGPPYHFMSRIASIDGAMGRFEPGAVLEAHYDVPPGEWYFGENGHPTMPFAVLMEAGLQPCGWLASYVGSALTTDVDLQFRNLDGTGTLTAEVTPESGTLRSNVRLTATSSSAGVLIVRFEVEMRDDHRPIFSMQTAFGFFPAAAMENQVGLPASADDREWLERPSDVLIDLTSRPERYCASPCRLAGRQLLMIDRLTGFWPDAGKAGLGRLRCEKDVDPGEWFFKAHFFQDPVQPGSLGIEAMIQALQLYMLYTGMDRTVPNPRFESLATERALTWKYRGQVLPTNHRITTELEITETGTDDRGTYALAEATLWVDGKKIYSATNLGMRIVPGEPASPAGGESDLGPRGAASGQREQTSGGQDSAPGGPAEAACLSEASPASARKAPTRSPESPNADLPRSREDRDPTRHRSHLDHDDTELENPPASEGEETLDPAVDPWIADHCPTWTLPALPMMSLVDRLAAAARERSKDFQVVGLEDVRVKRWVAFPGGPLRLETEVLSEERRGSEMGAVDVQLSVWRDAATPSLSRFEVAATGRVLMARSFCPPPQPLEPLENTVQLPDPYASGALFHGPAFHLLRELHEGDAGSSSVLDAGAGAVPLGTLHPALLDAATHGIPHDALSRWSAGVPDGTVAYPQRISEARFYSLPPEDGEVRCEARFESHDPDRREVVFHLQLLRGDRPWADLRLHEILLPKGPLGSAPAELRRAFLRDHKPVPGLGLSSFDGSSTTASEATIAASDWLPGTVDRAYGVSPEARDDRGLRAREVAIKDLVAARSDVHPSTVRVHDAAGAAASAVAGRYPLTRFPVHLESAGDGRWTASGRATPVLDLGPLERYWAEHLGISDWPVEDVYYGLVERFVRRVVVADPEGLAALYGRSTLFLANHQVGIESLLFSMVASALVGTPTVTLAKAEHRTSWLGTLIAHCFSYPGTIDPEVIAFFERENMRSLPLIIRKLGQRMKTEQRSVAVHTEGTRSLTCRNPVTALSGSFVDMAVKAGAAIVPVRFIGGLPGEPLEKRIEFPLGHGRQDYWLGAPLLPEELEKLRYKDRRQAVVEAINQLGPSNADEEPLPGNPDFAAEVQDWIARTGASPEYATIFKTLEKRDRLGNEAAQLVEAAKTGRLTVTSDPRGRWLAELARRLYGERGPRIEIVA